MKRICIILEVLFFLGCSYLEEEAVSINTTQQTNKLATFFLERYEKQYGHIFCVENQIYGHTLLVSHIQGGLAPRWGYLYAIPLQNDVTKQIDACIIYPIDEGVALEDRRMDGKIGKPIVLDAAMLAQLEEGERFVYSTFFMDWAKNHLHVADALTESVRKQQATASYNEIPALYVTKSALGNYAARICVYYRVSTYAYDDGNGGVVVDMPTVIAIQDIIREAFMKYYSSVASTLNVNYGSMILALSRGEKPINECFWDIAVDAQELLYRKHHIEFVSFYYNEYGSGTSGGIYPPDGNSGGGSGQSLISPKGDLSELLFSSDSKLTQDQWNKVEHVLSTLNLDCLGDKLLDKLYGKNIKLKYDAQMTAQGSYSHTTNTLTIKNFNEFNWSERTFEAILLHELLHAAQLPDATDQLNREIEVHVAIYRYAQMNNISLESWKYNTSNIKDLSESLDKNFNVKNIEKYQAAYEGFIKDLRSIEGYRNFSESAEKRNFNTVNGLSGNC